MLLPGLSGSFILILMGNYELILVESIVNFNVKILSLFLIGSVLGLLIFSHAIAFLLKKYKNQTIYNFNWIYDWLNTYYMALQR